MTLFVTSVSTQGSFFPSPAPQTLRCASGGVPFPRSQQSSEELLQNQELSLPLSLPTNSYRLRILRPSWKTCWEHLPDEKCSNLCSALKNKTNPWQFYPVRTFQGLHFHQGSSSLCGHQISGRRRALWAPCSASAQQLRRRFSPSGWWVLSIPSTQPCPLHSSSPCWDVAEEDPRAWQVLSWGGGDWNPSADS